MISDQGVFYISHFIKSHCKACLRSVGRGKEQNV
nr:MAG TPA: hypothetical protein [Caudoviricetes sp.]